MRTKTILTILTAIFVFATTGSVLFQARACGDYGGSLFRSLDVPTLKQELSKATDERTRVEIEAEMMRLVQLKSEARRAQTSESALITSAD